MNKNLTEMVFILDRSGSMSGLETDTIGGYNSLLEKQKKNIMHEAARHFLTLSERQSIMWGTDTNMHRTAKYRQRLWLLS